MLVSTDGAMYMFPAPQSVSKSAFAWCEVIDQLCPRLSRSVGIFTTASASL